MKRIENSPKGHTRFQFNAQLVAPLGATVLTNSNGKNYRIAQVAFENTKGVVVQASAAIYEGNYSKGELTIGESYLCVVTIAPNADGKLTPYIQMSHLVAGAGYADISDFDDATESVQTAEAFAGTGEIRS